MIFYQPFSLRPVISCPQTAAPATSSSSPSSAPVPTLLCSSAPRSIPSHPVPTVGQCLPQLTQDPPPTSLPATFAPSTTASLLRSLAQGSMPLSPTSLSRFTGSQLSAAPPNPSYLPTTGTTSTPLHTTARPPLTTATSLQTSGTTGTPLQTTGTTAALRQIPQQTNPQPVYSDASKTLPSTTPNSEPIKPGVPTPLPPGVNPETLGVLCRMPDSDLQKLKLPPVLMTAIRVWRGQQGSGRGRKAVGSQAVPIIIPPATSSSSLPSTFSHQVCNCLFSSTHPPCFLSFHRAQPPPPPCFLSFHRAQPPPQCRLQWPDHSQPPDLPRDTRSRQTRTRPRKTDWQLSTRFAFHLHMLVRMSTTVHIA